MQDFRYLYNAYSIKFINMSMSDLTTNLIDLFHISYGMMDLIINQKLIRMEKKNNL